MEAQHCKTVLKHCESGLDISLPAACGKPPQCTASSFVLAQLSWCVTPVTPVTLVTGSYVVSRVLYRKQQRIGEAIDHLEDGIPVDEP